MVSKNLRVNEQIRVPQVRLINQDNEQVGIIPTAEALDMARRLGLDLVEVAPTSQPPVCRIMDYGKFKYEQKKKEHKAKLKQHQSVLKEVRFRPKIDEHDAQTKLKKARQFLEKGDKVQFTMLFRGREMAHTDIGLAIFDNVVEQLSDIAKIESPARRHGRRMIMVLAPLPVKSSSTTKGRAQGPQTSPPARAAASPSVTTGTAAASSPASPVSGPGTPSTAGERLQIPAPGTNLPNTPSPDTPT